MYDISVDSKGNRVYNPDYMKHKQIIAAIVCVAVLGLAVVTGNSMFRRQSKKSPSKHTTQYTFDNLKITIPVSRQLAQTVNETLRQILLPALIPSEIKFTQMEKNPAQPDNGYIGDYTKQGKHISVLLTLSLNNQKPAYVRVWVMPPSEGLTKETATQSFTQLFLPDWTDSHSEIICDTATEANQSITICGKLDTMPDGSKHGITARDPIKMPPPPGQLQIESAPTFTILSACYIPPGGVPFYSRPVCI